MRLILTLSGGTSALPEKDRIKTLSSGSLSIGRGAGNGWVLPDPERSLSKTHCTIAIDGGRAVLTDTSTNGLFINGSDQATERDSRVVLKDGDRLKLGDYVISVAAINDAPGLGDSAPVPDAGAGFGYQPVVPAPPSFAPTGGSVLPSGPLDVDPLDDPFGRPASANPAFQHPIPPVAVSPRGDDPFDRMRTGGRPLGIGPDEDLFKGIQVPNDWQGASRPDHVPATAQAMPPMRIAPAASLGEVDFDALIGDLPGHASGGNAAASTAPIGVPIPAPAAFSPAPAASPFPPSPFASDAAIPEPPLAALPHDPTLPVQPPAAPMAGAGALVDAAGIAGLAAEPASAPARPAPAVPPVMAANPFDEPAAEAALDPMGITLREVPAVPPAASPRPATVEAAMPVAAPTAVPATASPVPVSATPSAPAADDGAKAALHAFLEGAGATGIDDSDPEAALRAAGAVFRAMTEGLREVLISRAAIKSEMRLEQTMIAAHGNNALKFSITADDAVTALLTPKRRGYMAPLDATREALSDIKSHEIAVMAGVQTALMTLLKRFDPDELEKRLTVGGLSAVLPGARKSRYWDAFRQIYGDITREAEDDFQSVFGRPFAKAYAAQTRKE